MKTTGENVAARWSSIRAWSGRRLFARDPAPAASNIRLFYWDGVWLGPIFGIAGTFLVVYVTRINASPWLLSAITSGPALVNMLWKLYAIRLVERKNNALGLTRRSAALFFPGYLALALVPMLLAQAWQPYAIVLIVILQSMPTAIWNLAYSIMLAEFVPRERLAGVVGLQSGLAAVTSAASVVLCGVILTRLPFPWGYQAIFILAFLSSLASLACLQRLQAPPDEREPEAHSAPAPGSMFALLRDRNFMRYVSAAVILNLGLYASAPLFPLRWVERLHLDDGWISAFATIIGGGSIVGSFLAREVSRRWDMRYVLAGSSILLAIYPLAAGIFQSPVAIALGAAAAGLFSGINSVAMFSALADVAPPHQRAHYMGVYGWATNIAVFAGPLAGVALAEVAGVEPALIGAGLLRIAAGALFVILPFVAWGHASGREER